MKLKEMLNYIDYPVTPSTYYDVCVRGKKKTKVNIVL